MPVIDIHTHMFSQYYFAILTNEGAPRYSKRIGVDGREEILSEGARFLMPQPGHLDHEIRIAAMDEAGVLGRVDALPAACREKVRGGDATRIFKL